MPSLATLRRELKRLADPARAKVSAGFFKIGKGEYGEGDVFIGLTVPAMRVVAREHRGLGITDIARLLRSRIHEERLIALLLLVERYARGDEAEKKRSFDFYLANADRADNWDLVDLSAPNIVGTHLLGRQRSLLRTLARSKNLWRRRIAIVATFALIRAGEIDDTFAIAAMLTKDRHDLIHKAVGWMLREAGKRDKAALMRWLKPRYGVMPRTMLRYAIERFPESERKRYLKVRAAYTKRPALPKKKK